MSDGILYTVKVRNGKTHTGKLGVDIKKTLDKRNRDADHEQPQIVYQIRDGNKWVTVWSDECEGVTAEIVKETAVILP